MTRQHRTQPHVHGGLTLLSPHVLVAGSSNGAVCGVRDHARMLSDALETAGAQVATEWTNQRRGVLGSLRLGSAIRRRCRRGEDDALLLHYSVFALAWRGIPLGVPILAWMLRSTGVPVVLFAHEFAYPWKRRGWKGFLHAVAQRVALIPLVAASDAVVVTTDDRVEWMRSRRWLPRRRVVCSPVFSNIPVSPASNALAEVRGRVGVFSFGAEGLDAELVTQAVARVIGTIPEAHLALIGGPSRDSAAGARWQRAAEDAGCPVTFTGIGSEDEISKELAACAVIFHADPAGPTSRKTTLAAAMAHGRPVVALDGPQRWDKLVESGAALITDPSVKSTSDALLALLNDSERRTRLGIQSKAFATSMFSPERTAQIVLDVARMPWDGRAKERTPGRIHRFAFRPRTGPLALIRLPAKALVLSQLALRAAQSRPLLSLVRFWYWQLVRRTGAEAVLVEFAPGAPFKVPAWSQIGGEIVSAGSHEPLETEFLDRLVRHGDVFVDVGANIGFYSVRLANAGAEVTAFEPTDRAADALEENANLSGIRSRVRVERCALADEDGHVLFDDSGDVTNGISSSGTGRLVPVWRLDTIAESIAMPSGRGITVLKVDAEGSDLRVLEGARDFITERRPVMMVEAWNGGTDLRAMLTELDYETFVPTPTGISPLQNHFWQANVVGVPSEKRSMIQSRLDKVIALPLQPPTVVRWRAR